jgi:hypothetical protein
MTSDKKDSAAKQTCPQCRKPASGNFCQHCGAALGGRFCNKCGAKLTGAAKFCNKCGAPSAGAPRRAAAEEGASPLSGSNAPWWIAGLAMFAIILVVGWNAVKPGPAQGPVPGMPGGGAGGNPAEGVSTLDIETMTPREAADRLFERVMTSIEQGDTVDALNFQPMAVGAYERAEPLNMDGLLHLALLQSITDPAAGLATAKRMLETEPDHVLGLGAAAQAALALGDSAQAAEYYQRLLDHYATESVRTLEEYQLHETLMQGMKEDAQKYLASR